MVCLHFTAIAPQIFETPPAARKQRPGNGGSWVDADEHSCMNKWRVSWRTLHGPHRKTPSTRMKGQSKGESEVWNPSQPMPWSYIEQHRSTLFLGILGWMAPWFMIFGISKLEVPTNLAWFQFLMDLRFLQDGRRSRWLLFFPHTHKKNTHSSKGVKLGKLPLKALQRQRKTHDSPPNTPTMAQCLAAGKNWLIFEVERVQDDTSHDSCLCWTCFCGTC